MSKTFLKCFPTEDLTKFGGSSKPVILHWMIETYFWGFKPGLISLVAVFWHVSVAWYLKGRLHAKKNGETLTLMMISKQLFLWLCRPREKLGESKMREQGGAGDHLSSSLPLLDYRQPWTNFWQVLGDKMKVMKIFGLNQWNENSKIRSSLKSTSREISVCLRENSRDNFNNFWQISLRAWSVHDILKTQEFSNKLEALLLACPWCMTISSRNNCSFIWENVTSPFSIDVPD